MKTKYILLILTAWLTASCSLQEDTEGFSTPGDFYKTKTQCQSAVNSCYIPLKNLYTYKMMIATEGVTDLMYIASGTQDAQLDISPSQPRFGADMWTYGYRGVMYSANFGTSLIAVALVTTFVMLAVTSNVVLSLGMVGALSIVRFRTAVKDPMDIAFLFWSLAAGIVLASGLVHLAVLGSLFIGIVMLVFSDRRDEERPYILVVHCADETSERAARDFASSRVKALSLKSKSVSPGRVELNYEVRLSDGAADFVNALAALPGVENAVLVSYNGDYAA